MKPISITAALAALDAECPRLASEQISIQDALDRTTAAAVHARIDLPPFRQSAMDGYAIRTGDVGTVETKLPVVLRIAAEPQASPLALPARSAARIFTGAPIPLGADAVVRQERARLSETDVIIAGPVNAGQDIRERGEEVSAGEKVLGTGSRITPGRLAMMAMAGVSEVEVVRNTRIVVLVTGDEIVEPGQPLAPGEVYNTNGPLIRAWMQRRGLPDVRVQRVRDDEEQLKAALAAAMAQADLVITTGGASVGDRDLIAPCAEELGVRRVFWNVAQKPGKPLYCGKMNQTLLLGLPGNPASVLVNLVVYVRHALARMEGSCESTPGFAWGWLEERCQGDAERDVWMRVRRRIDEDGVIWLLPQNRQPSHMLTNLHHADALAWIPATGAVYESHTRVQWLPIDD